MIKYEQIAFLRDQLLGKYFTSLLISWGFDVLLVFDMIIRFNLSFVDEQSMEVSVLVLSTVQ